MDFDFKKVLYDDEEILYKGKPVPGKGSKSIAGIIFLLGFCALMIFLMSFASKEENGVGGLIIFYLVIALFAGIGIYALVYNLFIKKYAVKDDFYCITNIRVLKYEARKKKLVYGYLYYYEDIRTQNVKDGYGDLYFGILIDEEKTEATTAAKNIADILLNPNPENMPTMLFESIKSPGSVLKIATDAKAKIKKTNK